VRSPNCEISIPEYQLTLPPTKRGQLTTVEGLIRDVVTDLGLDQPLRRIQDEENYKNIEALLDKLREILADDDDEEEQTTGQVKKAADKDKPMPPFTIKLDDPAGNSWIEFIGSMSDPKWSVRTYHRTLEHNISLGLVSADDEDGEEDEAAQSQVEEGAVPDDEVLVFQGRCSSCGHSLETKMKKVHIPYFKVSNIRSIVSKDLYIY
jgi:zinc finger protein